MREHNPSAKQSPGKEKNPWVLVWLAPVAFVLLLAMMIYLSNQFETLEERLSFKPPVAVESYNKDSFRIDIVDAQTVYVPVYSHIYVRDGAPHLLGISLSIRNSDPQRSIAVTSVRYYDTKGKPIQEFIDGSLNLGPLETTTFMVEESDIRGGSGANFIVAWKSDSAVYEPIIEAVMIGHSRGQSISFKSFGRPLVQRIEQGAIEEE